MRLIQYLIPLAFTVLIAGRARAPAAKKTLTARRHSEHESSELLQRLDALESDADDHPELRETLAPEQTRVADELRATTEELKAAISALRPPAPTARSNPSRRAEPRVSRPRSVRPLEPSANRYLPLPGRELPKADSIARVLAPRPEAIAEARRTLVDLSVPQPTRDKLSLLVSELVTNSVCHAGLRPDDAVNLDITNNAGRVRLAVHDGGQGFDISALDDRDPLTAGGQGLVIVAALSDKWGVDCHGDGCTVWCEVAVDEELAA
jgi:anti-sigma regulatory factor (Ser/Thr protein kinase)